MMKKIKRTALVVGAGPGGSSAAFYHAKKGFDVLLLDKESFPREKVCGDAWQSSLYPIFHEMEIYDEMEAHVTGDVKHIQLVGPDEDEFLFDVEAAEWTIPRRIGDDIVRRAALKAGADWMEGFEATELVLRHGTVTGVKGIYNNEEMQTHLMCALFESLLFLCPKIDSIKPAFNPSIEPLKTVNNALSLKKARQGSCQCLEQRSGRLRESYAEVGKISLFLVKMYCKMRYKVI